MRHNLTLRATGGAEFSLRQLNTANTQAVLALTTGGARAARYLASATEPDVDLVDYVAHAGALIDWLIRHPKHVWAESPS